MRTLKYVRLIALAAVLSSTVVGSAYAYTYFTQDSFAPYSIMPTWAQGKLPRPEPKFSFNTTSATFQVEGLGEAICTAEGCTVPCEVGRCMVVRFQRPS